jgi:predicted amidophosphoribosyltransferase
MEVRIQLKICEGCGCLWYRPQTQESIYCKNCKAKLQYFPAPDSRKHRGRPKLRQLTTIWAVAEVPGGAQ